MNRKLKILFYILGAIGVLLLLAFFGFNFWLKKKLPDYIRNHSVYAIQYKTLDVDVFSGNIVSTGISIKDKVANNTKKIRINGTIDSLKISNIRLFEALFKHEIQLSEILLVKPNLNITLAEPHLDKGKSVKGDIFLRRTIIRNGNINIQRYTGENFISVSDLEVTINNLDMTEKSFKDNIPQVFNEYQVKGSQFYFRPNLIYEIKGESITTENGNVTIAKAQLKPMISDSVFSIKFPEKRELFDFEADVLSLKEISLDEDEIHIGNMSFQNPKIKVKTFSKPAQSVKKKPAQDIVLDHFSIKNAQIQIVKPDHKILFSSTALNTDISDFKFLAETPKGNLPFSYKKINVNGKNTLLQTETQKIFVSDFSLDENNANFVKASIKPIVSTSKKALVDASVRQIQLKINDWGFEDNQFKIDGDYLKIDGLNGTLYAFQHKAHQSDFKHLGFPLTLKNLIVENSTFTLKGKKPITFRNIHANVSQIVMDEETVKSELPFKAENYSVTTQGFTCDTPYYQLVGGELKLNKNKMEMAGFQVNPKYSKARFVQIIPTERDWYNIRFTQAKMTGTWDLFSPNKFVNADQLTILGLDAVIFRSKIPPDDLTKKKMYSELLRQIGFPMVIKNTDIKQAKIVYEEQTAESDGSGKLSFSNFNLNAKNINSNKTKNAFQQNPDSYKLSIYGFCAIGCPVEYGYGFHARSVHNFRYCQRTCGGKN